jgi:hypothetical protein
MVTSERLRNLYLGFPNSSFNEVNPTLELPVNGLFSINDENMKFLSG